jgi:hypothetical protein
MWAQDWNLVGGSFQVSSRAQIGTAPAALPR